SMLRSTIVGAGPGARGAGGRSARCSLNASSSGMQINPRSEGMGNGSARDAGRDAPESSRSSFMTFAFARALGSVVSLRSLRLVALRPFAAAAQDAPTPAAPQDRDLQAAVEVCFSITDEAQAASKIVHLAASCEADPEKLLRAITTPPPRP